MTGAKSAAFVVCAAAVLAGSGCANLKRFAPAGLVKYEQIASKKPQNPVIKARIAETAKSGDGGFPDLSKEPKAAPKPMPAAERAEITAALRARRDAVEADIAEARAAAEAEGETIVALPGGAQGDQGSLKEARDALDEAVKKDEAAARKERGMKPRSPDSDGR